MANNRFGVAGLANFNQASYTMLIGTGVNFVAAETERCKSKTEKRVRRNLTPDTGSSKPHGGVAQFSTPATLRPRASGLAVGRCKTPAQKLQPKEDRFTSGPTGGCQSR